MQRKNCTTKGKKKGKAQWIFSLYISSKFSTLDTSFTTNKHKNYMLLNMSTANHSADTFNPTEKRRKD